MNILDRKMKGTDLRDRIYSVLTAFSWLTFAAVALLLVIIVAVGIGLAIACIVSKETPETVSRFIDTLKITNWDWVAMTIAGFSLLYACLTFNSQRNTEMNTQKINLESQREIFKDFIRHYYRNLVIITAVEQKLDKRFDTCYPSQEHILKLKIDIEDLHPSAFYNKVDEYNSVHKLQMLISNFNTECDVAVLHLCDPQVISEAKQRDINTLKFKMSYLAQKTVETMTTICGEVDFGPIADTIRKSYNEKPSDKAPESERKLYDEATRFASSADNRALFENIGDYFISAIFNGDKDEFLTHIAFDIYMERFGRNSQGSEKIMIIPFTNTRH